MLNKLEAIHARFLDIQEKLSDPDVVSDLKAYTKLNKEYKDLQEIDDIYLQYENVLNNIRSTQSMLDDDDDEMRQMAKSELEVLHRSRDELEAQIKILLIPKDPDDDKDVIFEIRSGTGGDEASIFAGDLYRMYTKFFESQGWKTELIDANEGTVGGFNKIVIEVRGYC